MEFRILGPLEVVEDEPPDRARRAERGVLLALLLLTPNRPVSVDRLGRCSVERRSAGNRGERTPVPRVTAAEGGSPAGHRDRHAGAGVRGFGSSRTSSTCSASSGWSRRQRAPTRATQAGSSPRRSISGEESRSPSSPTTCSRRRNGKGSRPGASSALERRLDAELALGNHAQLVPELEALVRDASTPRGPRRRTDACPLRRQQASGRARGLSHDPSDVRHGARDRAVAVSPRSRARDPQRRIPSSRSSSRRAATSGRSSSWIGDESRVDRAARDRRGARGRVGPRADPRPLSFTVPTSWLPRPHRSREQRAAGRSAGAFHVGSPPLPPQRPAARLQCLRPSRRPISFSPRRCSCSLGDGPLSEPFASLLELTPCDVGLLAAGTGVSDGPGRDPVRRGGARLVGDRARCPARRVPGHDLTPARHRGRPDTRATRREQAVGACLAPHPTGRGESSPSRV